jgi:4-hydroxybenzoate polyprenyltransferase
MLLHPYLRLTRLHQPTGIWLLLWPCWWAVTLARHDLPPLKLLALFFAGAVVMRSAGCVLNDIVDRKFDAEVERTRTRPLASGEVSLSEAIVLFFLLLLLAFNIVIQMKRAALRLAIVSLALVACYPFMKRVTWWPQAFLGLTFNWGALMGWAAVNGNVGMPALLLYAGGICWTLGYDTIYAHQDKEDDMKIGVKSTALRLGAQSRQWIAGFYAAAVFFWCLAGVLNHNGWPYFLGLALVAAHFYWQAASVKLDDPGSCLRVFRANALLGWLFFAGLWADGLRAIVAQL